jgi:hypothetical protein
MSDVLDPMTESRARDFVAQLYTSILRRPADEGGLQTYTAELLAGRSEGELISSFLASDEYVEAELRRNRVTLIEREGPGSTGSRFPIDYQPPGEAGRCYARRVKSGFLDRYCSGGLILDVGFSGYDNPENKTAVPGAIGIDVGYPGYDGLHLPFTDGSVDSIISSHCLEHILYDHSAIRDWYRALKVGGFIVCFVPHQGLYEKKRFLPSRWNEDHKRMYTPATLLQSFETALTLNSYRVRHLADNDEAFNYALGPEIHSDGAYEIELVIEKIVPPVWTIT